ncbi:MAG: hypothetical protein ORN26_02280 [Candidatus Pacebacteria bacterium]|nr:hypothetical protein [Candidatus Paceibacterota bacterium]
MTNIIDGKKGENKYFTSPNEAITAFEFGLIDMRAKIKILPTDTEKYKVFEGKVFDSSVGRLLFNSILPKDFSYINENINKKKMNHILEIIFSSHPSEEVAMIIDKIKDFGFKYSSQSGTT